MVAVSSRYLLRKRFEYYLQKGQYRDAALGENRSGGVVHERSLYFEINFFVRDLSQRICDSKLNIEFLSVVVKRQNSLAYLLGNPLVVPNKKSQPFGHRALSLSREPP